MSVMSMSLNYREACFKSHEFLRRGCSFTPKNVEWSGDIIIFKEAILKQSEVNDMRGNAADVEFTFNEIPESDCGNVTATLPDGYNKVEETDVRDGGAKTFNYAVPKNENPDEEENWSLTVPQTTNDCGVMMDFGDAYQSLVMENKAVSICGTVERTSGAFDIKCHYLDNRKSYLEDPDNGLLVCIRTGAVWSWEMRYAPAGRDLSSGLVMSDDVTVAFTTALSALGMTHEDVFEFGMI